MGKMQRQKENERKNKTKCPEEKDTSKADPPLFSMSPSQGSNTLSSVLTGHVDGYGAVDWRVLKSSASFSGYSPDS